MAGKIKTQVSGKGSVSRTKEHIKELREKLNAPDPEEIHPFTLYKIITYICVLFLPLVPVALILIWRRKTTFTKKEQWIWTAVIITIAVYMIAIGLK